MAGDGRQALGSSSNETAYAASGRTIDGKNRSGVVGAYSLGGQKGNDRLRGGAGNDKLQPTGNLKADAEKVPPPKGAPKKEKGFLQGLPAWAHYGGAATLGALQGFFTGGPLGAAAGAVLGLAGAYFFKKGDHGATYGIMAGAILGTALGGPIGGLIGAVVGGLLGHFIGKLFKSKD